MINLLPASEKDTIRKEYRARVIIVCLGMCSFVLVVLVFSYLPTYLFAISRYEVFLSESQSGEAQNRLSQVRDMEAVIQDTNNKITLLKKSADTQSVPDIFARILESRKPGIIISSFAYSAPGSVARKGKEEATPALVIVEGRSSDRSTLLAFKEALVQKKEFTAVDLPISSLVKETDLNFSIRLSLADSGT